MRVINVVKIKDNIVDEIFSFGVFEEQLSQEVVEQAETKFQEVAKELGCDTEDEFELENLMDSAIYESECGHKSVCISWSDI